MSFKLGVLSLILVIVSSNAFGATESKKIIRENGTGDYTSLADWQVGELASGRGNLVSRNEIAVAEIDGNWTNPDAGPLIITGWTTDTNHYVKIYTTPAARHSGVWDNTKYRIEASLRGEGVIEVGEENVWIDGLQISFTGSDDPPAGNNYSYGILIGVKMSLMSGEAKISNNIIRRTGSTHASREGGMVAITPPVIKIWNNIIYDMAGGLFQSRGIYYLEWSASMYVYNNTVYNCGYGIRFVPDMNDVTPGNQDGNGHVTLKNNLCFGNANGDYSYDYRGFEAASCNNISGDGSSPNVGLRNKTVVVNNLTNRDFHLTAQATDAIDSGADLSADSYISFATDIDGDTRPSGTEWDIGADERISGPITDTTPPTAPAIVRDGASSGNDSGYTTLSNQLSANWDAATDTESGISGYKYAIGSSPGAINVASWTPIGKVTTVTRTGLSLILGTTYYFSVKAINGATPAVEGSATNSNGQYVANYVPTGGVLRVHPTNPRYFTDDSGNPIYMTGSHTWFLIQKRAEWDQGDNSYGHMEEYLDWVQGYGHNFQRVWLNFSYLDGPFPWARPGPGTAWDGLPQFDMSQFDESYFDLIRERVLQITSRGMYVDIMIFGSGNAIRNATGSSSWPNCTWNPNNNINSALASAFSATVGSTFYTTNAAALEIQRALVRKTIDTLNDIDNLVWEVINEGELPVSRDWQYGMVNYIRSYESGKPKQHMVGMTGGGGADTTSMLTGSSADWISPDGNSICSCFESEGGSSDYTDKVVISDSDHLWMGWSIPSYAETYRKWVWKTFLKGHNPIFMDAYDANVCIDTSLGQACNYGVINTVFDGVREAMGYTRSYADRMDLANVTPQDNLASTGYCLAKGGSEYLVYQPGSGAFTLNLAGVSGTFTVEWFNPSTGVTSQGSDVTGGAVRTLTPPFSGDAVVYISAGTQEPSNNLALDKAATASSLEDTIYAAGNAVDGNTGTRWSSLESDPQWIYVDLGNTYNVNRVVLKWEAAYGRSYEIQVSANATDWTQVYATTSGNGGTDDISFSTVSARYVRMYGTQRGGPYCYSLWEFEVYGNTETQDTSSPTAPSSVRDGTGTDIGSTLVINQLSANWNASTDAESGISNYQYAIGTTQGGTQALGWTTIGNVTAVTKTGLSLIIGTTYYFSVKAINGVGLTSPATNSNGQVLISTAIAPDTTAPAGPSVVRDGPAVGSDDSYTYSTTGLSANWPAATDAQSGISGYEYAIGTTVGGTQTLTWTAIGNLTAVTKTGLSLTTGTTYYFSVRAINGQGLAGTAVNSNGQYVKAVIPGDTTPPVDISAIRDGLYLNMDISKTDSTTELSANWNATIDAESGVDKYWYAIGTTAGGSNVVAWTDNGQMINVTRTGLNLTIGATYYFSVKAENSLELQSSTTTSSGQYISEEPVPVVEIEITNIQIVTTANSVTITWVTNVPATSQVEYWTNPANKKLTIVTGSLVTSHSVALTGLTGNTQYRYRVISGDIGGDTTTSTDSVFSTTVQPAGISAYPNPCDFKGGKTMSFVANGGGEARIYTVMGKLVKKLRADSGTGLATWDGTNESGEKVIRGIYIYKITETSGHTVTGKIALTR